MLTLTGCLTALAATDTSAGGTSAKSTAQAQTTKQKKKKGWVTKGNGKVFYLNAKGRKVTGWKQISGNRYYFETAGKKKGRLVTGWRTIDGHRYYFMTGGKAGKGLGRMATGWVSLYGKTYYFAGYGVYKGWMATGWQKISDNLYYFSTSEGTLGQMATGWMTFGDGKYFFEDAEKVGYGRGRIITGLKEIDGKFYYFNPKGVLQKNEIVRNSDNGYFYVDSDGVLVKNDAIQYAVNFVMKNSDPKQTPLQRLRSCYDALCQNPYERFYSDHPEAASIESYALYMFRNGKGNCYRYGSTLAYIARVLGFESRVSVGGVTAHTYTNLSPHGWCEVKVDGVWKLCDCSMQRAHKDKNLFLVEWSRYPFRIRRDNIYTMQSAQGVISWI